jgi:hypothetical protein
LFKQIYAFENAHGQGAANMANWSDADRLREYERRLQIARKAGSDVGNITARTIDHWHRVGWYDLFYQRYGYCSIATDPSFCLFTSLQMAWRSCNHAAYPK